MFSLILGKKKKRGVGFEDVEEKEKLKLEEALLEKRQRVRNSLTPSPLLDGGKIRFENFCLATFRTAGPNFSYFGPSPAILEANRKRDERIANMHKITAGQRRRSTR